MKIDTDWTFIRVCPNTGQQLLEREYAYSKGVCPRCGDVDGSTSTHSKQRAGKCQTFNLFEKKFQGKRDRFIRKEEFEND